MRYRCHLLFNGGFSFPLPAEVPTVELKVLRTSFTGSTQQIQEMSNINTDVTSESDAAQSVEQSTDNASVSSGSNSSTHGGDEFFFGKFCRHVPRVLRHQVISKLVNQYIYKIKHEDEGDNSSTRTVSKQGDPGVDFKANTSIYRFHGALLFVDISGFTILSQKLKVDELKNQINAYFQKIVDIIHKYDGEIIKFAGDALFIIWQTKVNDTGIMLSFLHIFAYNIGQWAVLSESFFDYLLNRTRLPCTVADPRFMDAAKEAADKAVTCGVEINVECSSYAITLKSGLADSAEVRTIIVFACV